MAFPWAAIVGPLIGSLAYRLLFGGEGDQTVTQETTTETPPTGFKDPGLGLLAPLLLGTLTQNASRFSNFGVPSGGQMTPFLGGQNLQTLLDLLQKEYTGIASDYGEPQKEDYSTCVAKCKEKWPNEEDRFKVDFCIKQCGEGEKKGTGGR